MNVRVEYLDRHKLCAVANLHSIDRVQYDHCFDNRDGGDLRLYMHAKGGSYELVDSYSDVQRFETTEPTSKTWASEAAAALFYPPKPEAS